MISDLTITSLLMMLMIAHAIFCGPVATPTRLDAPAKAAGTGLTVVAAAPAGSNC